MSLDITMWSALWFLPFVVPICIYVCWSDMRMMKIPNKAVLALVAVFAVVGLIALPLAEYPWRFLQLAIVLALGILMNATGLVGAGDAKFAAAAAPFVDPADLAFLLMLLAATLLGAFGAHRLAKHSGLRRLAPNWDSWDSGSDFPMGLALGGTLALYLMLGAVFGG
ncbi:prepilin peptidase [Marinovum sp. 2_MG-2023]|uniref:prepilin peptidase n=1 Tax=Roseobacteraceae TaxID=2854170 RepID=UPI001FD62BDF|nr:MULTISPECIES: prepilin peptidase [Roseobacteraceae]MCJ7873011.1 prepilin peptidase [Phaeobacter sp. J2-8]MDO6731682.1 prepilin peptidase [Marinovum sp. 2_MG-2023]MDO6780934.1 prepilin peptidase [Marinovum sp. 1_MG-2023]